MTRLTRSRGALFRTCVPSGIIAMPMPAAHDRERHQQIHRRRRPQSDVESIQNETSTMLSPINTGGRAPTRSNSRPAIGMVQAATRAFGSVISPVMNGE